MANVPYKFYKSSTGTYQVLPGANVAAGSGISEVNFDEFRSGARAQGDKSTDLRPGQMNRYDWLLQNDSAAANAIRAAEQGQTVSFGKTDAQGNLVGNEALAQQQQNDLAYQRGELDRTMQNGVPMYLPKNAAKFEQGSVGQPSGQSPIGNQMSVLGGQQQSYTLNGRTSILDPKTGRYEYAQPQGQQQSYTINGQTAYLDPKTGRYEYAQSPVGSQMNVAGGNTNTAATTPSTGTTASTTGGAAPTNQADPNAALAAQYAALLGNTSGVDAAQKAIDDRENRSMQGQENIAQQPIADSFISGQQSSIARQAALDKIPLQQRLANEQAKRQAALDSSAFQLERSDKLTSSAQERADSLAKQKSDEAYRQAVLAETKRNNTLDSQKTTGESLTPYQKFQATQSISKDNAKRTENAREIARQANIMQTAYNSFTSGGDKNISTQAIITTFNKILDPTSVVRESEFDRTAAGQALLQKIQGKYENIVQGGNGVTPDTLKAAVDLANEYLQAAQSSLVAENQRSEAMATQFGLNPDFVTGTQPSSPQGGSKASTSGGGLYDW